MSNAWETTSDDVLNVIHKMGRKATSDTVETIFDSLDHFEIEHSAMQANDLETQTEYAYVEIERQIRCLDTWKELDRGCLLPIQSGITAALKGLQQFEAGHKTYTIPQYGITVEVSPAGGGSIQSGLTECLMGTRDSVATGDDDSLRGAIDALEALILGHACAGIDIDAPEYVKGLSDALAAIADNL
jgi:hypothetical protein